MSVLGPRRPRPPPLPRSPPVCRPIRGVDWGSRWTVSGVREQGEERETRCGEGPWMEKQLSFDIIEMTSLTESFANSPTALPAPQTSPASAIPSRRGTLPYSEPIRLWEEPLELSL